MTLNAVTRTVTGSCLVGLSLVSLMAAGCASAPKPLPLALQYHAPVENDTTASIIGSQQPRYARLMSDRTAIVYNIDGKRNMAYHLKTDKKITQTDWKTPIVLTAGKHQIDALYKMGGHVVPPTQISFVAEPQGRYQLQFDTDIGTSFGSANSYVDFWIWDINANQPVSKIVRAYPRPIPRTTYIPIVVPSR